MKKIACALLVLSLALLLLACSGKDGTAKENTKPQIETELDFSDFE